MRTFLRNPLTWLVVAEFVVVGALIALAWNAITTAARPALAAPALQLPDPSSEAAFTPLPDFPAIARPKSAPRPGLNLDSYFWQVRLAQLNQEQVYFERLEWRIVHSALVAAERYVQTVVIPSIERAESRSGSG